VAWTHGEAIVRREVLNDGRPWLAKMVYVVEDSPEQLVTYLPGGSALGFLEGNFPTPTGRHPWNRAEVNRWQGHGVLMVQKPGDDHALWHFWDGPDREFVCWYVNIQEALRRTPIGYDTQDLELDIVVPLEGPWEFKDQDLLTEHVQRGRYTAEQIERVLELGGRLGAELDAGRRWWDEKWSTWTPDPSWAPVDLPPGWQSVPTSL
jgi:hypothetical protein